MVLFVRDLPQRRCDRDVNQTFLIAGAGGPRKSSNRQREMRVAPRKCAFRHLAGSCPADGTMAVDDIVGYAEQPDLRLVGIDDEAALEAVTQPGNVGEKGGEQTPGTALCGREQQTLGIGPLEDSMRQRPRVTRYHLFEISFRHLRCFRQFCNMKEAAHGGLFQYRQISSADSSIPPDCDRDPRPAGANDPAAVHAGHPCGHRFRLADDCDRFADYSSSSSLSAPQMGHETYGELSCLFRAIGWVEQLTRQAAFSALQSSSASPQGNLTA